MNEADWNAARSLISAAGTGEYNLILGNSFSVAGTGLSTFTFSNASGNTSFINVTITGNNHILALLNNGNLLRIGANQSVIVQNVRIQGRDGNTVAAVDVSGTEARFVMRGTSEVFNNRLSGPWTIGGGVSVSGTRAMLRMEDNSSVNNNRAAKGGGVFVVNGGAIYMSGNSRVISNTAFGAGPPNAYPAIGGGILAESPGYLNINGPGNPPVTHPEVTSRIFGNLPDQISYQ